MRGEVAIVGVHRARRFEHAEVAQARIIVNSRKVNGAHRAVLVEQQLRAIDRAVRIQVLRMLQIANGFVDPILLLLYQRGIQPGRRILRIELFCQIQLVHCAGIVSGVAESFREIAAEDGALRLVEGGDLEVLEPGLRGNARADEPSALRPEAYFAQAAAEPRVAEGAVDCNGAIKIRERFGNFVLGCEQEAFQRESLGIARHQFQAAVDGFECFVGAAEAEFQFGDVRPGEAEIRRRHGCLACGCKSRGEIALRLLVVRFGEFLGGEATAGGPRPQWHRIGRRLKFDGGDQPPQSLCEGI